MAAWEPEPVYDPPPTVITLISQGLRDADIVLLAALLEPNEVLR